MTPIERVRQAMAKEMNRSGPMASNAVAKAAIAALRDDADGRTRYRNAYEYLQAALDEEL